LSNQGIARIDNLEVFSHIIELDLSNNAISMIENIDFLNKLEFIDVSKNQISVDGLLASLENLPKNLQSINISDNPCAGNEAALCALQDRYPNLNIIVGTYSDDEEKSSTNNEMTMNVSENNNGEKDPDSSDVESSPSTGDDQNDEKPVGALDADDILRTLVDRKCKLQSLERYNMDNTVETLNEECKRAIEDRAIKFDAWRVGHIQEESELTKGLAIASRVDSLLQRNLHEREDASHFKERLRQSADAALKAVQSDNATGITTS
jgi:hypothetical protein